MSLPVITYRSSASDEDLVRLFHQALARSTTHMAEPHPLDVGTAFCNPLLPLMHDANHVHDVSLPKDMLPADAQAEVESFYASHGVRCAYWTMNPAAPSESRDPIVAHLTHLGYRPHTVDILILDRAAGAAPTPPQGLTLIPARASFKHVRALQQELVAECAYPMQVADAQMMHLDDPHWDAIVALQDGKAAAYGGVLAVGELGMIENIYVAPAFRRRGLGTLIMQRLLEISARSLFRHVTLGVHARNEPATSLYRKLGFRKAGEATDYIAPWAQKP